MLSVEARHVRYKYAVRYKGDLLLSVGVQNTTEPHDRAVDVSSFVEARSVRHVREDGHVTQKARVTVITEAAQGGTAAAGGGGGVRVAKLRVLAVDKRLLTLATRRLYHTYRLRGT